MTDLTPRQQDMLARGLAAFDGAARARRTRRKVRGAGLLAAALAIAVLAADRRMHPVATGLPAYVEIIGDDLQLAAVLAAANACERIGRTDGRLCVVECVPVGDPRD